MCLTNLNEFLSSSVRDKMFNAFLKQSEFFKSQKLSEQCSATSQKYQSTRKACVQYLKQADYDFGTGMSVFATAVGILDVYLWKVKFSEQYMNIVSAACFQLACKMVLEDEHRPGSNEILGLVPECRSVQELYRVEMEILKKLDWNLTPVTYLTFLPLLADACGLDLKHVGQRRLETKAKRLLCDHSTVDIWPHVQAVALFQYAAGFTEYKSSFQSVMSLKIPPELKPAKKAEFPPKHFDRPSELGAPGLQVVMEE